MFTKHVKFDLNGGYYLARVIETLSVYRHGIMNECDLRIVKCQDDTIANSLMFSVSLRCRREDLTNCLDDILRLNHQGASIHNMTVK